MRDFRGEAKETAVEGRHAGKHGHRHHRHHHDHHRHGAKTFRRGRALEFLGMLEVKRATLKQQLEAPEYQAIHSVLLGELKAIESVIDEYTRHFEIGLPEEGDEDRPAGKDEEEREGDSGACGD